MATNEPSVQRVKLQWLPVLCLILFSLSACGGGDDGAPGEDAVVTTTAPNVKKDNIVGNITDVSVNSAPVVKFTIKTTADAAIANAGITGLSADNFGFYAARLVPGTDGDASEWATYFGGFSRDSGGSLVDHGDGSYTYTFGTDITADADYNASLTHRIVFEVRGVETSNGTALVDNPYYDFRPSDGATTGIASRDMVDTSANCNVCHGDLSMHRGSSKQSVEMCVVCHNTSGTSNDTSDFKRMIHKIHAGAVLPTSPIGDVDFPQDNRNCTTCHDPDNTTLTPDASNWYSVPTQEACSSCHDGARTDTTPDTQDPNAGDPIGHMDSFTTNEPCSTCHTQTQSSPTAFPGSIPNSHKLHAQEEATKYAYNIDNVSFDTGTRIPTVEFSVTDPTNNDEPYDLATAATLSGNLRFTLGYTTDEYTNEGNGNDLAQPARTSVPNDASSLAAADPDGDKVYSLALNSSVPTAIGSADSATVTLEGHPTDSTLGNLPVKSANAFFALDGTSDATARRTVVDIDNCNNCHQQLALHGDNRVDNPQVCVVCHNPNATDKGRRPSGAPSGTADSRVEQAIDFKYMIHAIHAANTVVWGFGFPGTEHDFTDVAFPDPQLENCTACHIADTYYPLDADAVLGTTISSAGDIADPDDNVRITPTTAVCSACHVPDSERDDSTSTHAAKVHMEQNGGDFNLTPSESITETCSICHGPGRLADIETVHEFIN